VSVDLQTTNIVAQDTVFDAKNTGLLLSGNDIEMQDAD
jgi:hypothetical protein